MERLRYPRRDLITRQQNFSGGETAKLVIEAVGL
jgi:hypothetical protein